MTKNRNFYYRKIYVLFEMLKCMKNKEVVFMDKDDNWKCIRGLWVKSMDYLRFTFFPTFKFLEKNYNIYISCANYEGIPPFTFNLSNRSKETKLFFGTEALNLITGYDLLLDFDCKDRQREDYLRELWAFYNVLDKNEVCFYIIFSGNNYQIVIPSDVYGFDIKKEKMKKRSFMKPLDFAIQFRKRFCLKSLDIRGVGVYNKLMKCPYSLVAENVVLPISNFNGKDSIFSSRYVLSGMTIKNRGLMLHNNKGSKNFGVFKKFCKKYYIKGV